MMKHTQPHIFMTLLIAAALSIAVSAHAGMEWSVIKDIALLDTPRDVAVTLDGTTAYVLCDTSIQIISINERRSTGSMPVGGGYSRIAITPSGDELIVTGTEKKQVSIIQVSQVYDIPQGTSPVIGNPKSPVTLTAFLDYQCPYCSKSYPLLEQTLAKYPNDVKLIIKHFPLKFHNVAETAAIAALAAVRQNKYKELSSMMMQQSSKLSEQAIRQCAQQAGLNMEQFDSATKDPAIMKQITDDMNVGGKCNVRGVPSIYINGMPIKSYTIESLSGMIDKELKKKKS